MNAAKKSERARLQHAVECVEEVYAVAAEMGGERLARVLVEDPAAITAEERNARAGLLFRYTQIAEECAHMDGRVVEALADAGVDVDRIRERDRNLGAHEADRLDAAAVHGMIVGGQLSALGEVCSGMLEKLRGAYYFPGQLEREAAEAAGQDASDEARSAKARAMLEAAEAEYGRMRSVW